MEACRVELPDDRHPAPRGGGRTRCLGSEPVYRPGPLAEAICFKVDRGSTLRRVAMDLSERGAVSSSYIFKVGADYEEKAGDLKAGSYLLDQNASMQKIVEAITGSGQSTCGNGSELPHRRERGGCRRSRA